jgi:hypothetical protein
MMSPCWSLSLILIASATLPIGAQSVISVRSGVINTAEGTVWLDSRRLEQHFGRYDQMKEGSELRTENGRVEVMLTPGVFLRIGDNSGIRMISSRLSDTKVEFLSGSMVLDSSTSSGSAPITIMFGDYQARVKKQGSYRFNSDPPELKVDNGQIELFQGSSQAETVDSGRVAPLYGGLLSTHEAERVSDPLDNWNSARNKAISENNLSASNAADLSSVVDGWQNDPDAAIRALEASGYIPSLPSRSIPSYAPLSSYPSSISSYPSSASIYSPYSPYSPYSASLNYPLSTYNPFLGNLGLSILPYGMWGLGYGTSFGLYASPLLRFRTYTGIGGLGVSTYRSPFSPNRIGIGGISPIYTGPRGPMYTNSPRGPMHVGGGAIHAGGHR